MKDVLEAMMNIPRHFFLDTALDKHRLMMTKLFRLLKDKQFPNLILLPIKHNYYKLNHMIKFWK